MYERLLHTCTGKWFSRSRNLLSCRAFSLFISTLHKNDMKQHYYKYVRDSERLVYFGIKKRDSSLRIGMTDFSS